MTKGGGGWSEHGIGSDLPRDYRAEEQEELDAKNRRSALIGILDQVKRHRLGPVGLAEMITELGLEAELLELAGTGSRSLERHRRLLAAWSSAGLEMPVGDETLE